MTDSSDPATRCLNPPDPATAGTSVPLPMVGQSTGEARQRAATDRQGLTFLGWSMTSIVVFFAVVLVAAVMAIAIFVLHVTPRHEVVDAEQQHGQPAKQRVLSGRR